MRKFRLVEHQPYKQDFINTNPLLQSVFDDSPDAIFILNPFNFQILDCNRKAIELFQASDKLEFIDMQSFNLYGSEPVEFSKKNFIEETLKGKEYIQELNFKTFDNNTFWGKLSQKLLNYNGTSIVLLRINKITDYNKTSEVLETIIRHTSKETGAGFFKTLTGLLASAFEAKYALAARLTGDINDSAESIEFYSGGKHTDNFRFNLIKSPFNNVINGYATYYPRNIKDLFPECSLLKKLNAESFLGAPVYNKEGNVTGMIVIIDEKPMHEIPNSRNILSILASRAGAEMERMEAEEKLRTHTEELARVNVTKDKFLQVIAHDLKNPVHTILGYSELLRKKIDRYDKTKIREIVNIIDQSVRCNYALLENLTEWSKMQRGVINFSPEKFDLHTAVLDANELYYLAAERKEIKLVNNIAPDTIIFADLNMLRTIFRNLVSNAIKFSNRKSEVIIDAVKRENEFIISVTDFGIGMAESEIHNKLCKEESSSTPGTDNEKGSGIGFSIVKDFIKWHKGQITIESKPGSGTKVIFTIPQ
ncbi:MAG: PAS domain-containing protein [Bacteroidales bacterium]|nr:PAS domain-containing protein [Bacteroidales bacterium]